MSLVGHLAELERKHKALDQLLVSELSHSNKDDVRIADLKRQKLILKDEINRLRTPPPPMKKSALH